MAATSAGTFRDWQLYYGDIHSHCGLSYGRGSLDDALHNARLQLDFTSVTLHGHWDDMPQGDPRLAYLVDYHRRGFERASAAWADYVAASAAANQDGEFVVFPSFEWHSMRYGDHCVYFRDAAVPAIFRVAHIAELRARLREHPQPSLIIPHHVGYRRGFRGINWDAFSAELSPVVEVMSFHGASEHSAAEPPYLHSMGPRDYRSTVQYGLEQGHIFGFIGSSDHHSAHPGSYGWGQMGVWAAELTRAAVWDAIVKRRTYALTGDRIALEFALNAAAMGAVLPFAEERRIEVAVEGAAALDYVEVLHNNRVIHRESVHPPAAAEGQPLKVRLEMGWGEAAGYSDWALDLRVRGAALLGIEPHLRGYDSPVELADDSPCVISRLDYAGGDRVRLWTQTARNPTVSSSAVQGITLHLSAGDEAVIQAAVNDLQLEVPLRALAKGARSFYLSGFVSPCIVFHRAVPQAEYQARFALVHRSAGAGRDWYYVRVRQRNGQCAWSSPIWVGAAG